MFGQGDHTPACKTLLNVEWSRHGKTKGKPEPTLPCRHVPANSEELENLNLVRQVIIKVYLALTIPPSYFWYQKPSPLPAPFQF